jgi:hypothetical protein
MDAPSPVQASGSIAMAVPNHVLREKLDFMKAYKGEEYASVLRHTYERFGKYDFIIFEDVVDDVYKAVDDDIRHLTPSRTRLESLCGMVDSKVSHMLEKERRYFSLESARVIDDSRIQVEETCHQLCDALREMCKDKTLVLKMLSLWEDDPSLKPRDFAKILGVNIRKVYKANEWLKQRTVEIREGWLFK